LVELIKQSKEPEFKRLRNILKDKSLERDMTFEDMRKLNPFIFALKDKS
jgi:hypothetical protein